MQFSNAEEELLLVEAMICQAAAATIARVKRPRWRLMRRETILRLNTEYGLQRPAWSRGCRPRNSRP